MTKLVVVDDENEIVTMIERFFSRQEGYQVKTFTNPVTALGQIKSDTDLVLLDIMMPQMDGLEMLEKLTEKYPDIHVVMMTAYSTLDKVLKAHRNGAVDYVMKPFPSLEEVKKKIESVLASNA
jgi:DNA-binding NtrC family response regulator